ncbi:MAG: hypothetical protein U0805_17965 [Pirellulales bacterium]
MDDELEQIEAQLAGLPQGGLPTELRAAVLANVQRELREARWDRRLARVTLGLLVVGVALNFTAGRLSQIPGRLPVAMAHAQVDSSLIQTAVVVAEVTDASTGWSYARQVAALSGREISPEEAAAIDAALEHSMSANSNGKRG